MAKSNNIIIKSKKVLGINNPALIINGVINNEDSKLILKIDGETLKPMLLIEKDKFYLKQSLKNSDKIIKIYEVTDNKEQYIGKIRNTKIKRVKEKVIKVLVDREKLFNNRVYANPEVESDYNKWLKRQEEPVIKEFNYNPLISVVIPVYNAKKEFLEECIDSVKKQTYKHIEICLVDDKSTNQDTLDTLKELERTDARIKVTYREENGNISEATNTGIKMAKGEFISFLDNDDTLDKNAIYYVVEALNKNKNLDFIYTDEDKINTRGRYCLPFFKPDYSPDTLLSFNYITHFSTYRKELLEKVGMLRTEYNGAQDFDLNLRVVEKTKKIYHIPKICYHWRMSDTSTALNMKSKSYALDNGKNAIVDALKRRKISGDVIIPIDNAAHYIVDYKYKKEPKVSILIPIKDNAEMTETCLKSIYAKTSYKNFEILLLNNRSEKKETFELLDKYKKEHKNFRVIDVDMEFNYSKINNIGAKEAKGDYVLLLNNDTEVIKKDWLHNMVGYAMQDHIGAVGAKLLYEDNTIQHCGVAFGIQNIAAHLGVGIPNNEFGPQARFSVPYDVAAVTAACLMISKKKYLEVGGLSEDMKVAFNDVEFNAKLLKKGYYNVCLPQVELYHYESKTRGYETTKEKQERFNEEKKMCQDKVGPLLQNDPFYNVNYSRIYPLMLDKKATKKE